MSVIYYSQPKNDFSDTYIKVRKKENRFYSEAQIKNLPDLDEKDIHYDEWQLRKKSTNRFLNHIKSRNKPLRILDIGCGNGWFSNLMSNIERVEVVGLDVNTIELEQATNSFPKENLSFVCANLFEITELNDQKFDVIVFNSCIQYFENLNELFQITRDLLLENGEIHIIDTPFYKNNEIESARQRTQTYYKNLGFQEMAKNYFHHCFENLGNYIIKYKPTTSFLRYFKKDSPFCWILIKTH